MPCRWLEQVLSARLSQPSEAKVVRRGAGRPKSTDGPFAETKEHLGGFYLLADRCHGLIYINHGRCGFVRLEGDKHVR